MTPPEELIEKVAKAIYEKEMSCLHGDDFRSWAECLDSEQYAYKLLARAALNAASDWLTAPLSNPQPGLTRRTLQAVDKSPPYGGHET